MTYDPIVEAADPVTIVHEQIAYWSRRRWTYAEMIEAVTGWKVRAASREVAFDILLLAWQGTQPEMRQVA